MTTQSLSSITLKTIENYRHAAELAVSAYRVGNHRLVSAVSDGLEKNVYSRTAKVAPQFTTRLTQVRDSLNGMIVKGIDEVSSRSEQAIEATSTNAVAGVKKVADIAAGVDNRIVANGIQTAVRLSLPGAQAALAVSAKIVEGADALSRVAGGESLKTEKVVKTVRKAAVRAKTATKAAVRKTTVSAKKTTARAKRKLAA